MVTRIKRKLSVKHARPSVRGHDYVMATTSMIGYGRLGIIIHPSIRIVRIPVFLVSLSLYTSIKGAVSIIIGFGDRKRVVCASRQYSGCLLGDEDWIDFISSHLLPQSVPLCARRRPTLVDMGKGRFKLFQLPDRRQSRTKWLVVTGWLGPASCDEGAV